MVSSKIPFNYQQARLLAVLALINFVNFADRQVLNPLVPLLRQHFNVSDVQLGSLQMVLLVVLALASIPFGYLADRFNEPKIICIGVMVWSLAAIGSGLSPTFAILFFALFTPISALWAERGRRQMLMWVNIGIFAFGLVMAPLFAAGTAGAVAMMVLGMSLVGLVY